MKFWLLTLMMWAGVLCVASAQPPKPHPLIPSLTPNPSPKGEGNFNGEGESCMEAPDSVATDSSNIYISLLTCSPGTEPYTLFGHTAIHMRNTELRGFDFVFNYGLFDYQAENFIYRFVKGETDYELGAEPTDFFMSRYVDEGHTVWEQELNLTEEEKEWLFSLIVWNSRPENKTYRYNFLYDNCTTRARDAFQRALLDIRVAYPQNNERLTFREIIHQFTEPSPWVEFGIDCVLGSEVDRMLDYRNKMFVPSRYHDLVAGAVLEYPDGAEKPFVKEEKVWKPTTHLKDTPGFPLSPVVTMWLLFVLTATVSAIDWRRRKLSLWLDTLWLGAQGMAGLLVAFLFFFSEHPAVGTNWLIILLNPLVFVLLVLMFRRKSRAYQVAEYVNLAGILFTLLLFVLPLQQLPPALLPVVLSLLLRGCFRLKIR